LPAAGIEDVFEESWMLNNKLALALVVATSMTLSGCWESDQVTLSEAGKYRGAVDPLLAQSTSARVESLQKRMQLVQVDR
jgi:hypothetical protein